MARDPTQQRNTNMGKSSPMRMNPPNEDQHWRIQPNEDNQRIQQQQLDDDYVDSMSGPTDDKSTTYVKVGGFTHGYNDSHPTLDD